MRRGGNYDQMQKTNMYTDKPQEPVDPNLVSNLAQSLEGLPSDAMGILGQTGGKKKKKGRKRPKIATQQQVQPQVDESMRSGMMSAVSGHSEARLFFEEQLRRSTGENFGDAVV